MLTVSQTGSFVALEPGLEDGDGADLRLGDTVATVDDNVGEASGCEVDPGVPGVAW